MPSRRRSLAVAFLMLGPGCSPPPLDTAAERRRLLERDAEWARVASEGKDLEKILSYWSEDAPIDTWNDPPTTARAAR